MDHFMLFEADLDSSWAKEARRVKEKFPLGVQRVDFFSLEVYGDF